MSSNIPSIAVTTVGSWPRSAEVLKAQKLKRAGKLTEAEFDKVADKAVLDLLKLQDEAGLDVVTDGEQRRDNFYSFVAEKLDGVKLMTLAELLEIIEDKVAFERILQTLDVPAYSISNPTCVGKVSRKRPMAVEELKFMKAHTKKPVKVPLPGPYLLTRAMFVREAARPYYDSKEALGVDAVRVLREEIADLIAAGADFIQIDEPVLTELVFTQGQTRTFMCAALAASKDPAYELDLAVRLCNEVMAGFEGKVRTGVHVCRGNWSTNEATLLRGSYDPLKPHLERMNVKQLVLEYATERAGDVLPFQGKELGLGVVNPRTEHVESVDEIKGTIQKALKLFSPDRLFVNPDCGFGTFSNRPINSTKVAFEKMKAVSQAARALR
jgi:5-methyltetrahydropteroyltriglutamate--homocysteine methyltransferase